VAAGTVVRRLLRRAPGRRRVAGTARALLLRDLRRVLGHRVAAGMAGRLRLRVVHRPRTPAGTARPQVILGPRRLRAWRLLRRARLGPARLPAAAGTVRRRAIRLRVTAERLLASEERLRVTRAACRPARFRRRGLRPDTTRPWAAAARTVPPVRAAAVRPRPWAAETPTVLRVREAAARLRRWAAATRSVAVPRWAARRTDRARPPRAAVARRRPPCGRPPVPRAATASKLPRT